ncbi:MAG TPA: hypothetical protein EYH31_05275, partial [Anaerolineae bacterium]|nr:hypothetical protein [Anaerolineae bacterium]
LEITRKYPKDQILEWYLNYNFYGHSAYGIEAASRIYFDKPARDLTLAEAAMLAHLPQYPALNPFDRPDAAYRRQNIVLDAMVDAGFITPEQAVVARRSPDNPLPLREAAHERFEIPDLAPHFAQYALRELKERYNTSDDPYFIWRHGLRVYTTIDLEIQNAAECLARIHIANLQNTPFWDEAGNPLPPPALEQEEGESDEDFADRMAYMQDYWQRTQTRCEPFKNLLKRPASARRIQHNVTNASVVVIRPSTGEILAMVGSLDYKNRWIDGEVNVALAERQPGSSFKPFTYLTALKQGYTAAQMILDVRTVFPDPPNPPYVPENYDRKYHGPQRMRQALARSYNIPAVWMMQQVGVKNVLNTAHRMGINTLNKDYYGLSLTLGGGEVRLIDMTYAFSAFANGGYLRGQPVPEEKHRPGYRMLDPVAILQVRDKDGNILYQYQQPETEEVVSPQLAYIMTSILSDRQARCAAFGCPNALELSTPDGKPRPAGAKTGTTNQWKDAWTIGFTPQLAAGVWAGNSDNESMDRVPGSKGAAPIWQALMNWALRDEPPEPFVEPPGLVHERVCAVSGLLSTEYCPETVEEIFLPGTVPTQHDTVFQVFEINKENGKLATIYTPPELREKKVYMILPEAAADWVREQVAAGKMEQPPRQFDDAFGPGPADPEVAIISPAPYSFVRGLVEVRGNARMGGFRSYRLEFGEGLNPQSWMPIGPEHFNQIGEGPLEYWDTSQFDGLYTLRLTVRRGDGGVRQAAVQVTVDNAPPTVELLHPFDGKVYVMEDDEWISITA